jgi:UDP-N-acetyl-D-mannosaminuronic acid transferase (WecB/TagA/CpsF family)
LYCQKICHKIGFYLQKIHGLDLVRMKVKFSIDEFNRVYLLGASEILVRQARKVPAEDETMLGEFILRKITSANRARK